MEPLLATEIKNTISPEHLAVIRSLEIFDCIDSTNTYLLQHPEKPSVAICLAEQQTKGHGQRGRAWVSPKSGNIYLSLSWPMQKNLSHFTALSLMTALGVLHGFNAYGIHASFQLKWPNDILYDGRKVVGILLESVNKQTVVVGIGINVNMPKQYNASIHKNISDLETITGETTARNRLVGYVINEVIAMLKAYETEGFQPYLQEWHQHDYLLKKQIHLTSSTLDIIGTAQGINEQGKLLIKDENGKNHAFSSGSVKTL
ncbi:MAG: biotin--[acetyl-CoA-carboxylase] ligase [Pseudomonadota bacterium]